jgi:hypothetical protein
MCHTTTGEYQEMASRIIVGHAQLYPWISTMEKQFQEKRLFVIYKLFSGI